MFCILFNFQTRSRDELKKSIDEMRQFIQVTLQTSGINEP